jgi:2-succinyl-5-enolpyruvyl-6-hydroxy-3-cyclohexene-1-carboxylate synthase
MNLENQLKKDLTKNLQPNLNDDISTAVNLSNVALATATIQLCINSGVEHFVICAGARNAPFVKLLSASRALSVSYFYDERAAGFFALGRAKRDQRPVAVITTSGTAVAELMPSAVEAFYSGHPLVFITADRPKNFRGTGSPQSINQPLIFGEYAYPTLDLDQNSNCPQHWILWENNLHINTCFSEPLLDSEVKPLEPKKNNNYDSIRVCTANTWWGEVAQIKKPIFVISTLNAVEQKQVADVLSQSKALQRIYVEATSGLQGQPLLTEKNVLSSQDLKQMRYAEDFDSVIRIGGVPTIRFWRDLEMKFKHVPVISFSRLAFSGLGRRTNGVFPLEQLPSLFRELPLSHEVNGNDSALKNTSIGLRKKSTALDLVKKYSRSEPALLSAYINTLSAVENEKESSPHQQKMSDEIFVGNSLPIRELDLFTHQLGRNIAVTANRGANGIDGLISTAQGLSSSTKNMHVILGDLSALYDLNALSQQRCCEAASFKVVVINNQGGKIFKRMFQDVHFENKHDWRFKSWAEMFDFEYISVKSAEDLVAISPTSKKYIIELLPDSDETDLFWQEYEKE